MREELLYNVCLKSGVLPPGQIVKPAELLNADDSVWGDDASIYSTQNETTIVHFFGLWSTDYEKANNRMMKAIWLLRIIL